MRRVPFRVFSAVTVASTSSVESGVVDLRRLERDATITLQGTSVSGTADVKLEVKYSADGTTFNEYTDQDALVSSTLAAYGQTPEGAQQFDYAVPGVPFAMFRVTGVASNPADTAFSATMWGVEL